MRLFIAEKPELGRAIAEAIGNGQKDGGCIRCGNGDVVTWCFGHLLTLTDPEDHDPNAKQWSMDSLPLRWPVEHKPIGDKESQIKLIQKLAGQASEVINAADCDDEGQLLVDELLDYIGNTKPVKRLLIPDMNKKIVQRSLANMRDNREFFGLYQSALARSVSDQVYGYNLTRAYTLAGRAAGATQVLSVGRVQTPILGLVVRRDRAHESHSAHNYYDLMARFAGDGGTFTAKHRPADDAPVDDKGRVLDETYAANLVQAVKGQPATVTSANTEDKEAAAPLPYNLLNLQADASRKFGFSPDKTLKLTQSLREKHRLITYNRSDCEYLSDEQHDDAPAVLAAIAQTAPVLAKAAQSGDPAIKSRAFNSKNVSAHHAIVPTENTADLAKLSDDEGKLYLLIARAYIAQFWPKHAYRETTIDLEVSGYAFRTTSRITTLDGWKKLYARDTDNDEVHQDDADSTDNLEWVTTTTPLTCEEATSEKKQTKPPARYTMATLLKDLARVAKYVTDPKIRQLLLAKDQEKKGEHGGIGTPATRSAIIEQLMKRGFIAEQSKKVISTELGREFHDLLPESATAPDMTALWHEQQEQIKAGQMTMQQFVDGVAEHIAQEIERIKTDGVKVTAAVGPECPTCGKGTLQRRKGKSGFFWGCSAYPDCKATFPDKRGKPDFNAKKKEAPAPSSEHLCPKCSKGLIRRAGKKRGSYWWGCSGFPACDFRAFDNKGKPEVKE
jgi:DNA topoisomerase-3